MYMREIIYRNDIVIIRKYGESKYKLVYFKRGYRESGFEAQNKANKGKVNEVKLSNNIVRAKNKVFELSYCNDWDWFVTLTIDKNKYDRTDLKTYKKDLSVFIQNYKRKGLKIKYLLIPELHKDGKSWHMHGFIKGLPSENLEKNKNGYLDWKEYSERFGYISLDKIRNQEAASKYITKYINKSMENSVKESEANLYYRSQGLKESEVVAKGTFRYNLNKIDFKIENDYVKVAWVDEDLTQYVI